MKQFLIYFALPTVIYSLSSCQNDAEEIISSVTPSENLTEKFTLKSDYLAFNDNKSFSDVFNSIISDDYSIDGELSNDFNSLKNRYKSIEESYNLTTRSNNESEEEFEDTQIIKNRVGSFTLTKLLNDDGVIKIGTNIYKFDGNYAYIINDGDENTLKKLLEGKEYSNFENVSYEQVIFPLISEKSIKTKSSTGETYERSPVFITTNNSDRREHVKFNPYLLVIDRAQTEIVIEMEGRAQKKKIFGIWGTTFSDEMVWGEIHLNSGSWHYNQPPAGGMPIQQGTNYFITGRKARTTDHNFCGWAQKLGNTGGVSAVKANITFKTQKSPHQPTGWSGEYTNNYTSIKK